MCMHVCVYIYKDPPTSEVFNFEVFRAGFLPQQRVVQHDFSLSFDAFVKLPHGHVTQPLHVLTHLVVRLQLKTPLRKTRELHCI